MDNALFALEFASQVFGERGVEFVIFFGPFLRSLVSVFEVLAPLCVVEVHGRVRLRTLQRRVQNLNIPLVVLLLLLDGGWTRVFGHLVGSSDPLGARLEIGWCNIGFEGTLFPIGRNFL